MHISDLVHVGTFLDFLRKSFMQDEINILVCARKKELPLAETLTIMQVHYLFQGHLTC